MYMYTIQSLYQYDQDNIIITLIWNHALSVHSLISHAVIRSIPPPTQGPCIAAITGLEH